MHVILLKPVTKFGVSREMELIEGDNITIIDLKKCFLVLHGQFEIFNYNKPVLPILKGLITFNLIIQDSPELGWLWEVGKKMWERDFAGVYVSLKREWPEYLTPLCTKLTGIN